MYAWQLRLNECIGEDPYEVWTLKDRMTVLAHASSSLENARAFKLRCKTDRVFFTNACVDTYNPRLKRVARDIPFFLELRQAEYLMHLDWCVQNGLDRACIKTRYTGASWLEMDYDAHEWLFEPGYVALVGSRTIELVDGTGDGDKASLFAKFDYIIDRLPPILKEGMAYSPTAPNKVKMLRNNPDTKAQITGEPVTADFGSGPRATSVLVDELSKCQHKESAWEACGQTTDCRRAVFTAKGKDFAYGLVFPAEWREITGKEMSSAPEIFRVHWKDIPRFNTFYCLDDAGMMQWREFKRNLKRRTPESAEAFLDGIGIGGKHNGYSPFDEIPLDMGYDDGKGNITRLRERKPLDVMPHTCGSAPIGAVYVVYPWYERERLKYDEEGAAQELDIDFKKSVSRKVYVVQLADSGLIRLIERDPALPLYIGLDPGRSAGNAAFLIWAQFNFATGRYEWVREYTNEGRDAYFYVPLITGLESHYQFLERSQPSDADIAFFEESQDPAWQINMAFGDPFIDNKGASNDSWKSVFTQHGIPIRCSHELKTPWDRVQALRAILPYSDFSQTTVPKFKRALEEIYLPPPTQGTATTTAVNFAYVHHPIYSHPCAAGEYLAVHDPHRKDRGIIDNEEDSDDTRDRRGNRPVQSAQSVRGYSDRRHGGKPGGGLPDGYILVNGVATPRSAVRNVDPEERYLSRTSRITGWGGRIGTGDGDWNRGNSGY